MSEDDVADEGQSNTGDGEAEESAAGTSGGEVAVISAFANFLFAVLVWLSGESVLVVALAAIAGGLAAILAGTHRLRNREPTARDHLFVAIPSGAGAVVSLSNEAYLTALGLGAIAAMHAGQWAGWRTPED